MWSGASFYEELCALELKWLPLCRDTVHYLRQDCIKRGQLSGTPAAGLTHTHTQMQCGNTPWKMEGKAGLLRPRGSLSNVQSRSTTHTHTHTESTSTCQLTISSGMEAPGFPRAPNPHNHSHAGRCCDLFQGQAGSCLCLPADGEQLNDRSGLFVLLDHLALILGPVARGERLYYTVFRAWICLQK